MGALVESPGRRERHRASLSEINVTPLVDVVLVLLIIFMVTAPMMQRGVDVELPRAESAAGAEEQRLIVTIDRANRIYLNQTSMPLGDLQKHLSRVASSLRDPFVYLRADQAVPYGRVMAVMDHIKKAGIARVGLVTEPTGAPASGRTEESASPARRR